MEKRLISFANYDETIRSIKIDALPELLQNGHRFFKEARFFYDSEPVIRETINLYLERLNAYLFSKVLTPTETSVLEIDFIQRFLEMHKTVQTKEQLKTYIFELQTAISKKQITKNSSVSDQIDQIQRKLINTYNDQLFKGQIKIVINRK